jgi:hypothetical protein
LRSCGREFPARSTVRARIAYDGRRGDAETRRRGDPPDAIEYVVRIEASDGSFAETRTSSTSYTEPLTLGETYKVSACNRIGCTGYVTLP